MEVKAGHKRPVENKEIAWSLCDKQVLQWASKLIAICSIVPQFTGKACQRQQRGEGYATAVVRCRRALHASASSCLMEELQVTASFLQTVSLRRYIPDLTYSR